MSPSSLRREIGQLLVAGFNGQQIPPELKSLATNLTNNAAPPPAARARTAGLSPVTIRQRAVPTDPVYVAIRARAALSLSSAARQARSSVSAAAFVMAPPASSLASASEISRRCFSWRSASAARGWRASPGRARPTRR